MTAKVSPEDTIKMGKLNQAIAAAQGEIDSTERQIAVALAAEQQRKDELAELQRQKDSVEQQLSAAAAAKRALSLLEEAKRKADAEHQKAQTELAQLEQREERKKQEHDTAAKRVRDLERTFNVKEVAWKKAQRDHEHATLKAKQAQTHLEAAAAELTLARKDALDKEMELRSAQRRVQDAQQVLTLLETDSKKALGQVEAQKEAVQTATSTAVSAQRKQNTATAKHVTATTNLRSAEARLVVAEAKHLGLSAAAMTQREAFNRQQAAALETERALQNVVTEVSGRRSTADQQAATLSRTQGVRADAAQRDSSAVATVVERRDRAHQAGARLTEFTTKAEAMRLVSDKSNQRRGEMQKLLVGARQRNALLDEQVGKRTEAHRRQQADLRAAEAEKRRKEQEARRAAWKIVAILLGAILRLATLISGIGVGVQIARVALHTAVTLLSNAHEEEVLAFREDATALEDQLRANGEYREADRVKEEAAMQLKELNAAFQMASDEARQAKTSLEAARGDEAMAERLSEQAQRDLAAAMAAQLRQEALATSTKDNADRTGQAAAQADDAAREAASAKQASDVERQAAKAGCDQARSAADDAALAVEEADRERKVAEANRAAANETLVMLCGNVASVTTTVARLRDEEGMVLHNSKAAEICRQDKEKALTAAECTAKALEDKAERAGTDAERLADDCERDRADLRREHEDCDKLKADCDEWTMRRETHTIATAAAKAGADERDQQVTAAKASAVDDAPLKTKLADLERREEAATRDVDNAAKSLTERREENASATANFNRAHSALRLIECRQAETALSASAPIKMTDFEADSDIQPMPDKVLVPLGSH